jgi:hypothetical protein
LAITDYLTNLVFQDLSQSFVIASFVVGYWILFVYFYGTDRWNSISFGERLIFGFLFGVPFAMFSYFASYALTWLAFAAKIGFNFDLGVYVGSACQMSYFGLMRLRVGEPLHSKSYESRLRNYFARNHIFYAYLPSTFAAVFIISTLVLNPSIGSDSLMPFFAILALVVLVGLIAPFVLLTTLTLTSPGKFREFVDVVGEYISGLSYFRGLRVKSKDRPRHIVPSSHTSMKIATLGVILLAGVYLPFLDTTSTLFIPHLNLVTTSYGDIISITSNGTQGRYIATVPVTKTYNFTEPLIPFFTTVISNPSSYSTASASSFGCYGHGGTISASKIGSIKIIQDNGTDCSVTGYEVEPLGGWPSSSVVKLSYTDLVVKPNITISPYPFELLNKTTMSNGTIVAWYGTTISNGEKATLEFDNFYAFTLPSEKANYTGEVCYVGCEQLFFPSYGTSTNLYLHFDIQPNLVGRVRIEVWYNS